jgi:hypothetical protein
MSAISSSIGQVIAGGCRLATVHDCGSAAAAAHVTSSRTTCRHASYQLSNGSGDSGWLLPCCCSWLRLLLLIISSSARHQLPYGMSAYVVSPRTACRQVSHQLFNRAGDSWWLPTGCCPGPPASSSRVRHQPSHKHSTCQLSPPNWAGDSWWLSSCRCP